MRITSSDNKKIYLWATFSKIIMILSSLISSALINRSLGVELKGEYAYIINLVNIVVPIFSFGIGQTYSTYRRKYGKETLNTFVSLTLVQAAIALAGCIFTIIFKGNYYIWITLLLSSGQILRTNLLYITAVEDIKKRDINNIFYKIIYIIFVIVLFYFKRGSLSAMLSLSIIDEVIIVVGTFYSYKLKPDFKFIKYHNTSLLEIYRLGFISMLMCLMMTLNYNIDIIFLKKMCDSSTVGLYSVGTQLANMLWLIPDAFKDVIVNKTSKEDSIEEIVSVTKFCLYLALIIICGFAVLGKMFIRFVYGEEFVDAFFITLLLFWGTLSMIIYKIIHPLYISKGRQGLVLKILTISVITNIFLNLIAIPRFGKTGAAIASVISYSVCSIIFLSVFCKENNIPMTKFFIIDKNDINRIKFILKKKER